MANDRKNTGYLQGELESLKLRNIRRYEELLAYFDYLENLGRKYGAERLYQKDELLRLVLHVDKLKELPPGYCIFPSRQVFFKNKVVVCKEEDKIKIFALGSVTS
jgi:hypothetical protein